MICFIPTKGRFNTKTYKLFEEVGIEFLHFIEPNEIEQYNVPNKISVLLNDKGVSYVRNFMLEYAKNNNLEWVLFCDDDVDHFGKYENSNIKLDASIWIEILSKAKKLPFEIVGINYRQLAWTGKNKYSINRKFVEVCVLLNVSKIKWNYRENTKEDRDFVLQTIKNGNGVLRFNKFFYNCPNVGTNAGGLQEKYKQKEDAIWAVNIVKQWYPFAKLIKTKGRVDAKVDIKAFAEFYKKQVK